jgi:outer membrane PBP1 activator LpoA protein
MKRIFLLPIVILLFTGCSNPSHTRQAASLTSTNASTWQSAGNNADKPQHIALLLPLTGPYSPYANAIRNGFFTEYYTQKQQSHYAPSITVYDTQGKNIQTVYDTAIKQGADFIVGPLDKSDVTTLANASSAPVTTLALNSTSSDTRINNNALYEFSLSPTDEAQQAAIKAHQDHHKNVIIIAPQNPLGQRMVNAFTTQWKQQNDTVVATAYYTNIASLSKNISNVLGINEAYQDAHNLKNTLRENVRFIPHRRNDFDSIFLVANPVMAKQIIPLLQFYFAGNIPTYSTSQIYPNTTDPEGDLDGILFCNMPWILQPNAFTTTQQKIKMLWPDHYPQLSKFYAMGVDAFNLTAQFKQLQSHSNSGMPGATGTLYLSSHYIYRQLMWAKIQNGEPRIS